MADLSDGRRGPRWLLGELFPLALFLTWVGYVGSGAVALVIGLDDGLTDRQEVLLMAGYGLAAPLVAWVLRVHVTLIAGARPDLWWWRLGTWTRTPVVEPGTLPWWERARSGAFALASVSAFLALYAGSLLAAFVFPVAVWTLILGRLRRPR